MPLAAAPSGEPLLPCLSPELKSELLTFFAVIKCGVFLGDGALKNEGSSSFIGAGEPHPQAGTREDKTGMASYLSAVR